MMTQCEHCGEFLETRQEVQEHSCHRTGLSESNCGKDYDRILRTGNAGPEFGDRLEWGFAALRGD